MVTATTNKTSHIDVKLQCEFLRVVGRMTEAECPLPDDFRLYYLVIYHRDRMGGMVHMRPFLTEKLAMKYRGRDQKWKDKYGSAQQFRVIDSDNEVRLENYRSGRNVEHEIDFQLPD